MSAIRYSAAACQTDLPNPIGRPEMKANTDRMLAMVDAALAGAAPFLPVRLVVFPEFAHAAPVYATVRELSEKLAVEVPNEHTDRLQAKAKEHGVYLQSGTMIERDPRWPGFLFNATCLIGPGGILYKYRKVNPWIPYEVHASPHDVPGYDQPLFPVADTEIGRIGCAICYDWVFPEALRQLAMNGAEVLVRVSAYMDPWGATEPMDWWTVVNRARALENVAYVVAANQGAQLRRYPPYSWPGGSMVVDFDGRVLAQDHDGLRLRLQVGEPHRRIDRGFHVEHAGVPGDCPFHLGGIREVDEFHPDFEPGIPVREERVGTAVERFVRDDLASRPGEDAEDGGNRPHPA